MIVTLKSTIDDALARQQFYADAETAYAETLRTNAVYRMDDVKVFLAARVRGDSPQRPAPVPLDPSKPLADA